MVFKVFLKANSLWPIFMKFLKAKKILFDHAPWSRLNLLVYSSQRELDPGLETCFIPSNHCCAEWPWMKCFPSPSSQNLFCPCSLATSSMWFASYSPCAWHVTTWNLGLGWRPLGDVVVQTGGEHEGRVGKIFKDSCPCPCLCVIAPSTRHLSLSNTLSQSEQYFEGKEAISQCGLQNNKNIKKIKFKKSVILFH